MKDVTGQPGKADEPVNDDRQRDLGKKLLAFAIAILIAGAISRVVMIGVSAIPRALPKLNNPAFEGYFYIGSPLMGIISYALVLLFSYRAIAGYMKRGK